MTHAVVKYRKGQSAIMLPAVTFSSIGSLTEESNCVACDGDGVFGTAGPKADSSFSKKMNEVIIEVYGMSTCIQECMTAI